MGKSTNDIAIKVEHVSKTFRLPHEKHRSLKSSFLNIFGGKNYELQQALEDINFEVKKGEFFGIVGRNGSGKSTLLKCIAGVYAPSQGNIKVNGTLVPFIELGVGFNPELSGRDNVFLNGALLGFSRKQMEAMYDEIVEFAELEDFMDQKLKNYSSGMQVRLAFSIAIRARGDILLLDEVLAVGDSAFQQKCFDYFEKLKNERRTVVLVTHDMGAVNRFCTKAIYIKNGELIEIGTPMDIADVYVSENIRSNEVQKGEESKPSPEHKVAGKVANQTASSLSYKITYESKNKEKMYVGISIIYEGRSVAEITTALEKPLTGSGIVTYELDTTKFNAGSYRIDTALFRLSNRELIAVNKNKNTFQIKGYDITKGAALRLSDSWRYK